MPPMYSLSTTLSLEDAKMHIKAWINTRKQFIPAGADEHALTFVKTYSANVGTAIVLFLLGILPGLIYLAVTPQRKEALNIFFKREGHTLRITLDAGINTQYFGRSLASCLRQYDPALESPQLLPSVNNNGPNEARYVLYVMIGASILAILGAFVAATLP